MRRLILGCLVSLVVLGVAAASASAETPSPWWSLTLGSRPTALVSGGTGEMVLWAENLGDASTSGAVSVSDRLPVGLKVVGVEGVGGGTGEFERGAMKCSHEETTGKETIVTCVFGEYENAKHEVVHEVLPAYEMLEVRISVKVSEEVSEAESSSASVSGGGALRDCQRVAASRPSVNRSRSVSNITIWFPKVWVAVWIRRPVRIRFRCRA